MLPLRTIVLDIGTGSLFGFAGIDDSEGGQALHPPSRSQAAGPSAAIRSEKNVLADTFR